MTVNIEISYRGESEPYTLTAESVTILESVSAEGFQILKSLKFTGVKHIGADRETFVNTQYILHVNVSAAYNEDLVETFTNSGKVYTGTPKRVQDESISDY